MEDDTDEAYVAVGDITLMPVSSGIHRVFLVNLVVSPRYCESGAGPSLRFENRGCNPGRPRTCKGDCNERKGLRQKHMDTKKGKGTILLHAWPRTGEKGYMQVCYARVEGEREGELKVGHRCSSFMMLHSPSPAVWYCWSQAVQCCKQ